MGDNTSRISLTAYEVSSYSSGMMYQSDQSHSVKLYLQEGTPLLCVSDKAPFGPTTTRVYRVVADVFDRLNAITAAADLKQLSELKPKPPEYVVYDYSAGGSVRVEGIETMPNGIRKPVWLSLNPAALHENGYGALLDEMDGLVKQYIRPENLLQETVQQRSQESPVGMAMSAPESVLSANEWRCPSCGNINGENRFCSECGACRTQAE